MNDTLTETLLTAKSHKNIDNDEIIDNLLNRYEDTPTLDPIKIGLNKENIQEKTILGDRFLTDESYLNKDVVLGHDLFKLDNTSSLVDIILNELPTEAHTELVSQFVQKVLSQDIEVLLKSHQTLNKRRYNNYGLIMEPEEQEIEDIMLGLKELPMYDPKVDGDPILFFKEKYEKYISSNSIFQHQLTEIDNRLFNNMSNYFNRGKFTHGYKSIQDLIPPKSAQTIKIANALKGTELNPRAKKMVRTNPRLKSLLNES